MPFSDQNNKHILIVTVFGPANKPDKQRFKLTGMMRIQDVASETFIQPLPADTDQLVGITFDRIEFVVPASSKMEDNGDFDLTHYHANMKVGKRSA